MHVKVQQLFPMQRSGPEAVVHVVPECRRAGGRSLGDRREPLVLWRDSGQVIITNIAMNLSLNECAYSNLSINYPN